MRQQRTYIQSSFNQQVKPYSISGYSTMGSPKNINIQNSVPIQNTNLNNQMPTYINPQRANFKPISVPIFSPTITPNNINHIQNQYYVSSTQNVGATSTNVHNTPTFEQTTSLTNPQTYVNRFNLDNQQQYQRISNAVQRVAPSRPNYHFFGNGADSRQTASIGSNSRQVISKSISPGIAQPIKSKNEEPHSLSPVSIRSNSSQANIAKHKIKFFYTNNLTNQTSITTQKYLAQNQTHVVQQSLAPPKIQTIQQVTQHINTVTPIQPIQVQPTQITQTNQLNQINQQGQQLQQIPTNQLAQYQVNTTTVVTNTTIIWQHRFVQIYSKFQIFVEKFQSIIEQIYYIDDLFDNVNDEQAWNDLRVRYADMIDNFNMMREDIILVLEQNKTVINSLSPEVVQQLTQKHAHQEQQQNQGQQQRQPKPQNQQNYEQGQQQGQEGQNDEGGQTGKSGSQNNHIWENRCMQLMQQHQLLTKQNNELKYEIQRLRMQQHDHPQQKKPVGGQNQGNVKVLEMQKNLNLVHSEYQKLQGNYNKLSMQYSRVVSELQNRGPISSQDANQDLLQMQQQLEMAQSKINQLYEELQKKTENIDQLQKEIQSYGQILQQNKALIQTVNKMNHDLDSYDVQLQNKEKIIQQYDTQIKKYHAQATDYSKIIQQQQYQLKNQPVSNIQSPIQTDKKNKQIDSLKQQQKYLLTMIEKHEQTVQDLIAKNKSLISSNQIISKEKDQQIKVLQRFLEQQRTAKHKLLTQNIQIQPNPLQNLIQSKIFKERLEIQIEEVVKEKNRKIRHITQDLEDLRIQIENIEKDKQKEIKQIKLFFAQQEDKYIRKIHDKQAFIKLLQQKTRSFQTQLSNRNLEISRFRHQSPVNSFGGIQDESRKYNQTIQRKNHDIQQLKRTVQQKNIQIKELEQRNYSFEQQVNSKMFEINALKRQINDLHTNKAEIDNLNNILKKKNQQINQIRLTGVQLQQLKMNIDSSQREKLRINQYLKQKTRECQSKDNTIQVLQRKISAMSTENVQISKKYSTEGALSPTIANYQNLLKQKQTEIKNLKYELQMVQTKISIGEKSTRDLNSKVNNYQKSAAVLKAEMQNKVNRYETEIRNMSKQLNTLKDHKLQYKNLIQSLNSKNASLQSQLDERNNQFDRQIGRGKEKILTVQQVNTALQVQQELLKSKLDRLTKQNKDLIEKIKVLENKIESKNNAINQIKGNYSRKQKEDVKTYEDKIKKLDGDLKLSSVKLKNMEQQIANLNKKIQSAQSQKRSYRQRLLTQHNNSKQQYIDFKSQYEVASQDILQMDRFRLKDPQANDVFERKVIYELKKQNDLLRRQLSGIGHGSYSVNKDSQAHYLSYQQQFLTERDQQYSKQEESHNQIVNFYKNKNKQLQSRVDELLKLNNQFKAKLASMGSVSSNQLSIQFYKDQVTKLELQNSELQAKIKKMLSDHQSVRDQATGHQFQAQSLQQKLNQQNLKINQFKSIIRKHEDTISQLENSRAICNAEIDRLKQIIQKAKNDRQQLSSKERIISQLTQKHRNLQQQVAKLNNKISLQSAEIQRLNELIKNKKSQLDNRFSETSQESKKLKLRISQLEKQLQMLNIEHHTNNQKKTQNSYKIQKLRSFLIQIQSLVGEISLSDRRSQDVIKQIRQQIQQGFNTVSLIQV